MGGALLAVGLGVLVVVVIVAKYQVLTRMADQRKRRRDGRSE